MLRVFLLLLVMQERPRIWIIDVVYLLFEFVFENYVHPVAEISRSC
jgi:hypothetical protein